MKTPVLALSLALAAPALARVESRPVHPLAISAGGDRLYAVNAAEARLSVFAVGPLSAPEPVLIAEIPVALNPVSVRLRNSTEAWVVCELSDAITVIDLARNAVKGSIKTGDEPADVAFANGLAFVSCSRDNTVEVYSADTLIRRETLPLAGLGPRSLAASPDGSTLHIAFLHSGNGTTVLPKDQAPPQPAPTNPALPTPPRVALIVPADDPRIPYSVVNHDLAHLALADFSLSYTGTVGTNLFEILPLPSGELLIPHTEARNLIRFEPALKARFLRNRLARYSHDTMSIVTIPLDTDPDTIPAQAPEAAATALAQPMAAAADHATAYLAAFGSDRIGVLDLANNALAPPIDLRAPDPANSPRGPRTTRGPRGLALHPTLPRLYSYNKLSHTLSIIDTAARQVLAEVPLSSFPDLDAGLKIGRALLHDARLSGNGSVSCASCHIDLDRDGLAWDLGDPSGEMLTVSGALNSLHAPNSFVTHNLHPMKGPMVTQTLSGLHEQSKLHWRGDKPNIQSFNATFENLLGGNRLAPADMDRVADYLLTLRHHPNPHLKLDRTLPATLNGGDPAAGIASYILFENHCSACHHFPSGSSNNLDLPSAIGSFQAIKDPPFRTTYQRAVFDNSPGAESLSGFGLLSDGSGSLTGLPVVHPYSLHILDDTNRPLPAREKEKRDLTAFLLAFDSGTAPAAGHALALTSASTAATPERQQLAILEAQAGGIAPGAGLVLRGTFQGGRADFLYESASGGYRRNGISTIYPAAGIVALLEPGDLLLATGVPLGEESRLSLDRDNNDVADPLAAPFLQITGEQFRWPITPGWYLESSPDLLLWQPETARRILTGSEIQLPLPGQDSAFGRLRRTW